MYVCLHKTGKPRARAPCKAKGNCSKWPVCSAILAPFPPVLGTALKHIMFLSYMFPQNIIIVQN